MILKTRTLLQVAMINVNVLLDVYDSLLPIYSLISRNYTFGEIMRLLIQNLVGYWVKQNIVCINSELINNHRLTENNVLYKNE